MSLRLPGRGATGWVFAETAVAAVLSLLSMLLIGRVIGPEQTGLGAMAVSAFLILDVLGAALFPDALVQRRSVPRRMLRSAATAAFLVGAAGALLLAGLAWPLAAAVGREEMAWLLLALAPLLPVSALSGTASGMAMRDRDFRLLAGRVLIGQPISLGAGLLVAAAGHGAWAMVAAQAAATLAVFVLVLAAGRVPARPALDGTALRALWPVAGPQIGALVVTLGQYRLFLLAAGLVVAEAVLAHAHFAFRLLDAVLMMVWQAVTRLGVPRLCAAHGDREALARHYGELARLQALLGLPCAVGVALVAPDVVAALLGPAWAGTADAAQVAGFAAVATLLHGNHFSLFLALGRTSLNLRAAAANMALPLVALAVLRPETPAGIAAAWATPWLLVTPVIARVVLRELDRPFLWLAGRVLPALLAVAAMVPAVLAVQEAMAGAPPLPRLVLATLAGGAAYVLVAWLLLGRGRRDLLGTLTMAAPEGGAEPPAGPRPRLAAPAAGDGRLAELDALRGLAALAVLLHHAVQMVPRIDHPAIPGLGFLRHALLHDTPLRVIEAGRPAVLFFFVLSGYVLMRALLRGGSPGLAAYAAQRSLRLGLPVVASVLLSAGLWWAFADPVLPEALRPHSLYTWLEPPSVAQVLGNALLLSPSEGMRLNVVLWSLVHEWRLTLLLPLLLAFRGRAALFAALALAAMVLGTIGGAAEDQVLLGPDLRATLAATLYFAGAVGAGVALALAFPGELPRLGGAQRLAAAIACLALFSLSSDIAIYGGAVLLVLLARQPGRFRDLLRRRPLAWLGRISFSLYLVHVPVLVACLHALHAALPPLAIAAAGTVLALPAAMLMHRLVEQPSRRLARGVERRLARRHAMILPARREAAPARDWGPEGGVAVVVR